MGRETNVDPNVEFVVHLQDDESFDAAIPVHKADAVRANDFGQLGSRLYRH